MKWIMTRKELMLDWKKQIRLLWISYNMLNNLKDNKDLNQLKKYEVHKVLAELEAYLEDK